VRYPFALSLAALTVALASAQPPKVEPAVAATVNGETISLAEVDAALKQALPNTQLNPNQLRQLRAEVVSELIDDLLVRQFLRKNGPKIEPGEIDAELKAFAEKLQKEGKSLAQWLKETGQTEAQVRESWTAALQLTGYVKITATEAQLKAHFQANRDYFDRVEVKVRHILVRASKNVPATERTAAREKLEALRGEIAAGKLDFAAAAKKHSHCPSAAKGGDIGYIFRKGGLVDDAVAKAAFALKPGELSGVVETDFGFHILQVTDRKPGTPAVFEKCFTEVLDSYSDDFRADLILKLRKEAQIQITVP
jgi:peptidyl-prolyl cis-trans isomerase C